MKNNWRSVPSLRLTALVCLVVCGFAASAFAGPRTIYLVRHAERGATTGPSATDTHLSATGRARAERLAAALKDAKITGIYTTEYKRTQETAAPLVHSLGIQPEVISAGETSRLVARLKVSRGNVLVVGHSNTLPLIINLLGVSSPVTIAESEFDNLFVVVLDPTPHLIHRQYR